MRKRGALLILAMAIALSLAFATQASGLTVAIENPDASYLTRTTKIDFSALADGTEIKNVTDGNIVASLDASMTKLTQGIFPYDAGVWGNPGEVEEPHPSMIFSGAGTTMSMQLNKPVHHFGFESAPMSNGDISYTVTFIVSSGDQIVDTVTRTIPSDSNAWGARLFAVASTTAFDRVDVVINDSGRNMGIFVAQLRYSEDELPSSVTVSGTVTSEAGGVSIPFAHIYIEQGSPGMTDVTADYQGRYSVTLPPGNYTFHVSGPGWAPEDSSVEVVDESIIRNFVLGTHNTQAVYRFFNMKGGVHFFTASDVEFMNVYANLADTFKFDGIAYFVDLEDTPGQVPLYRFFNQQNGVHFYTASEAEKTRVETTQQNTYNYEGIAYGVRIDGVGTPVYRFYVPARNAHFYTANTGEIFSRSGLSTPYQRDGIGEIFNPSELSSSYHYEGIGYWVGSNPK